MTPVEASARSTSSSRAYPLSPAASFRTNSSHLHPEDAFLTSSPLKLPRQSSPLGRHDADVSIESACYSVGTRRRRDGRRGRSANKRVKEKWKKLLWVKQAYPDNYTDEETFLDQLKRNPRLRPYEFWSLVADSTIIVQHVASVIIFVCCFTVIFQERVSPVLMVTWTTIGTVLGWVLRDYWVGRSLSAESTTPASGLDSQPDPLGIIGTPALQQIQDISTKNWNVDTLTDEINQHADSTATYSSAFEGRASQFSARNQERLVTAKSAVLIYAALLGLSPILKSLTKSTSPDSIWAISSWLIIINVFTFDYGAGVEAKFPASLSTNAALMASTVLASRLPSTTHVFSITLFSIEIFGLFPVFRRHLRHHSYQGHLLLTVCLVVSAGGGLCVTITGGGWVAALVGIVLGVMVTGFIMGMTSWWLIGLQRYKNEIRGPWDPARPIIRRHWD